MQVAKYPVGVPAYASTSTIVVSLPDLANRIASDYGIATTTLANLVQSESQWDPNAVNGQDRGLVQINSKYWPDVSDAEAFDPEFALKFAADAIKNDKEFHWVSCNCVAFIRTMGVHFPRLQDAKDLDTNSSVPMKGGVIKMVYNGIYHLAYITSVEEDGIHIREANYSACLIGKRVIAFNDKHIVGFYTDKT